MSITDIKCARCGVSCPRWEVSNDDITMEQVFRVWCHGEMDECRIDWRNSNPKDVVEAVAFRRTISPADRSVDK